MYELERRWSYRDIVEAHEMLDALEDADYRAHEMAKRATENSRPTDHRAGRYL